MRYVLTVIGDAGSSDPESGDPESGARESDPVNDELVAAVREALATAGATAGMPDWLAPGAACDIPFDGAPLFAAEDAVRERLAGRMLDLAIQPAEGRRKDLLVADMESTIIGQEMIDELAEVAGLHERIAMITARAMAGELDFDTALRQRVALLTDLPIAALEKVSTRIALNRGARTLVQTMRAAGAYCALVSGGFTVFTDEVAVVCGFDEARGNRLEIADGKLTGRVTEPILGRDAKRKALLELADRRDLPLAATCAVGDGANDLAMLESAGLGVAYRAKPILREAARARIDHGDLTALLYLQGYRRDEFHT